MKNAENFKIRKKTVAKSENPWYNVNQGNNIQIAKTLLSENVDISTITKSTGLSKKDILKLKDGLVEV